MSRLFYYRLTRKERLKRLKKTIPFYVIVIIVLYWKLSFLMATTLTVILVMLTVFEWFWLLRNKKK